MNGHGCKSVGFRGRRENDSGWRGSWKGTNKREKLRGVQKTRSEITNRMLIHDKEARNDTGAREETGRKGEDRWK